MITRKDVMPTNYYKKEAFTGSDAGMRYMLRKKEQEDAPVLLEAIVWPQPFSFEKTPDDQKVAETFTFDEEGIEKAITWLNGIHEERKDEFIQAQQASGL
jgi:hypothetical protein